MSDGRRLLLLPEVAARLRVTNDALRHMLSQGKGPPAMKRPGSNRWLFWEHELDAWIEEGRAVKLTA